MRSDRNRFDDNEENIRRRIETFQKTTAEVIDGFRSQSKLHGINSDRKPGRVALQLEAILDGLGCRRRGLRELFQERR